MSGADVELQMLDAMQKETETWGPDDSSIRIGGGVVPSQPLTQEKFGSSGKWGGAASQRQAMETAALCKPWKNK